MNARKEGKPLVVENENAGDQKEKEKANTFALLWKLLSAVLLPWIHFFFFLLSSW